ncbi:MAG: SLC13 family permease [Actinomycetota bacterium]|nr:SLC13 family permease [Actinomycetota bacterium]MDH5224282.1 SLC13 family permease [Actinomycetota bacterium]MDH5314059.1 SLC13 family permease [Actinomycetota bacterium]
MTWEAWFTLAVVMALVAVLATERLSPPLAVLGAAITLLVAGVIEPEEAFSGFSNPAPITVAALYVLAAAVEKTGALERLTFRILGAGGGELSDRTVLTRVLVPTALSSAFLNNTPIVAMIAPNVVAWARRAGRSPSPYLIPISFAAILGGVLTLIGTSTNLVVSGLLEESGSEPLGLFEITKVSLPLAVVGVGMLILLAPRLLPTRQAPSEGIREGSREFTVEMVVEDGGALAGKSVAGAGLRNLEGVYLVGLERDGSMRAPVGPEETLEGDDRLTFAGNVARMLDLQRLPGLRSAEQAHFPADTQAVTRRFFEAVVADSSPLANSTLKDVGFRARYAGAVVAVHRAGERLPGKLGGIVLRPGDVLLVLAGADFVTRWRDEPDFLVVAPLDGELPPRREKSPIVGIVTVVLFATVAFGLLDILEASLLAAIALVVFRVLTPYEARQSIDLNVIVLIAASFGVGAAMSASGLANEIATKLIGAFDSAGDLGLIVGILIATVILTELITNNAAAVLMFPIAVAAAQQAGIDTHPVAIAVAIGASSSFLTPIGYQTNTMVYGMGGYRFGDFARVGVPLTILMIVVATVFIPLSWPL